MSAGRKNKGATLIEVMTALFIVVITTVTAATVITDTARSRLSQQEIMAPPDRQEAAHTFRNHFSDIHPTPGLHPRPGRAVFSARTLAYSGGGIPSEAFLSQKAGTFFQRPCLL